MAISLVSVGVRAYAEVDVCPSGISPDTAQRLFDRVKRVSVGGGYQFEGLGTKQLGPDKMELAIVWSLNGKACPTIYAFFDDCHLASGPPKLRVDAAPELDDECPALRKVVAELATAARSEQPADWSPPPVSALPLGVIAAAVGLALGLRYALASPTGESLGLREFFLFLFTVIATNPLFVRDPLLVTAELGTGWLVFALLLFASKPIEGGHSTSTLLLAALFCLSLLLRWSLSTGGPGDLRLNLAAIWSSDLDSRWGQAPIAFFRGVAALLGGIEDTQIIWCNLLLGSCVPLLLYGILANLGIGSGAALSAALVAAAHPLLIAFSGVLERQPLYLFAALGSTLSLIGFLQRGGPHRFVAFVLGTILAIASRPEGAQVMILQLAVLLFLPGGRRERALTTLALGILAVLGFSYARHLGTFGPGGGGLHAYVDFAPFASTVLLRSSFTPAAWIVVWSVGLALSLHRRATWVAVATLLGIDLVWKWTGVYKMFSTYDRQVASARYETILLVPFVIGVSLFFERASTLRREWRACLAIAFVLSTAFTFQPSYRTLLTPFTVDYEYQFLRRQALHLPKSATVYVFDSPVADAGFDGAEDVPRFIASPVRFVSWSQRRCDDLPRQLEQSYLYIGSSCAEEIDPVHPEQLRDHQRWLASCLAMEARVSGDAVETMDVPAHKMAWHDFKEATVRLGLYRLTDASVCEIGPLSMPRDRP